MKTYKDIKSEKERLKKRQLCRSLFLLAAGVGCIRGIMAHLVEFRLRNIEELLEEIDEQNAAVGKAVSYTVKDIKSRAPGWIAAETASRYNIKKSEITPSGIRKAKEKPAASISVSGDTLESISIVYAGRNLTPIHFSMSPRVPIKKKIKGRRAIPGANIKTKVGTERIFGLHDVGMVPIYKVYAISYEVLKGSRRKVKGKRDFTTPFLAPVKAGSDKYIIFQRRGRKRTDMHSLRTVSVPQMIGNDKVEAKIGEKIMGAAEQRLRHHLDRFTSKNTNG